MRLASLHLRAYGPFTDVVLPFENPAGLQIVFGPNEAGKSSALRGINALLFGISGQTPDAFLYEYGAMRIGAVLVGEDGSRHALMRRKGNKNVLFAFDERTGEERSEKALGSDYVARLLPDLDENLFNSLFGLSHERLRSGGEALVAGEGDLGSAIFAAGSGLSGVRSVLGELEATARSLFIAGGSKAIINGAIREHEAAKSRFRDAIVRPKTWKEFDQALTDATRALKLLEAQQRQLRSRESQKQRLIDLRPRAVKRTNLIQELAELHRAVKLGDDVRTKSTSAQARISACSELIAAAKANIEASQATLTTLEISSAHLQAAAQIEALHYQAGPARKAYEDLGALTHATQHKAAAITDLVADLDPSHPADKAKELVPSSAVVTRLRTYCRQLTQASSAQAEAERVAEAARAKRARAEEALKTIPEPGDTSALDAALESLMRQGDLEKTLAAAETRRKTIGEEIRRLCTALDHLSEESLFSLAIPQRAVVAAFQQKFQELAKKRDGFEATTAQLTTDIVRLRGEIKGLEAIGEVVTAESLGAARERRELVWAGVRRAYVERSHESAAVRIELALEQELPESYERQVRIADEQADLLRADTARATRYSELRARIEAMSDELGRIQVAAASQATQEAQCHQEWSEVVEGLKLTPRDPQAVLEWLVGYDKVKSRAIDRDAAHAEEDSTRKAITDATLALEAGYAKAGLSKPDLLTMSALTVHAREQLKLARDRRTDLAQLKKEKQREEQAIGAAQVDLEKHTARAEALRQAAKADLQAVRLALHASLEEIEARLEVLKDLSEALVSLQQTDDKLRAAQSAWEEFVHRMRDLATLMGLPEVQRPDEWLSLAAGTYAQLKQAQERQAHAEKLRLSISADKALIASEAAKQKVAQDILDELVRQAKCQAVEELGAAIEASERRRRAERSLEELEGELSQYAQDELPELLAASTQSDLQTLQAELVEVQRAMDDLEPQIEDRRTAVAEARSRLAEVDGTAMALTAKEEMAHHEALMQREALDYARTRFAHALLSCAIRAYQEKSQGPLIERASKWFEHLTEGRYCRLVVDHHDDKQVLTAEKTAGRRLQTWELSEGTADQLYLALRLAAIELRLGTSEAVPLILDDALLAFDDNRTMAALQALAEVGKKNQTILFTHHQHVVELARKRLSPTEFSVHELPSEKVRPN